MKFIFDHKTYNFPTSLRDITLKQRIEFDHLYGKEILSKQKEVLESKDELESTMFQMDVACKNFSFFSGIELEEVRKLPMNQVLSVYQACFEQIAKEEQELTLQQRFEWKDELWDLEAPELNHESKMTFNEFVTAKQIVKTMHDMGSGQWDALPSLCAIFLRKVDEPFDEKFISGSTDRTDEMMDLPLDIALSVGFFLRISMSTYSRITQSSSNDRKQEKVPV